MDARLLKENLGYETPAGVGTLSEDDRRALAV